MAQQDRFQFPSMLGPPEEQPNGTPAWAMRVAAQVEMYVERVDQFGVDHLCRYLTKVLNEPVHPWDIWPEDEPCQSLDRFFQLCCGRTYDQIHALIAGYLGDVGLTRKLDAAKARADRKLTYQPRDQQDKASKRPAHRPKSVDNENGGINSYRPTGTSVDAALRRLRKDRADLHARVLAGEISAHAAMVEAGFRKRRSVARPSRLTRLLREWQRATAEDQAAFLEAVGAVRDREGPRQKPVGGVSRAGRCQTAAGGSAACSGLVGRSPPQAPKPRRRPAIQTGAG